MWNRRQALLVSALAAVCGSSRAAERAELRVAVHSSFALPKPLLAAFESQAGVKLSVIKAGNAGEMLNKLILTRDAPVADAVFGLDNTLVAKATSAGVLEALMPQTHMGADPALGGALSAVDYGYVTLNADKAEVARRGLPLPTRLQDLAEPAYAGWLSCPNPALSSTGYAFLLATIAGLGEAEAFAWWARLRANGLRVAKGWSEAYYTNFSRNKGSCPLVVSYATSPAAEVFYAKSALSESPTVSVNLKGGVFKQVEGVGFVRGGAQREAATAWVDYLRSTPVQEALQTSMWMYPAQPGVTRAPVLRHAPEPPHTEVMDAATIAARGSAWLARWTEVVLK